MPDNSLGYRPGLDGVRGIAILMVLASHTFVLPSPLAGQAGVTVFFVLSGYLITRILVEERDRTGRINLTSFYRRRAARLLPALILMLVLTLPFRPGMWWSAGWALSYAGNWWWSLGHDPGIYGFTWSLAIEEQFYLVWPLLLLGLLAWQPRPRMFALLLTVFALAGVSFLPLTTEFRSFSTITNAPWLTMGAAMALGRLGGRRLSTVRLATVLLLGLLIVLVGEGALDIHLGATVAALEGGIMIVCGLSGAFAWRPLVGLGRISYGVYLWHLPVLVLVGAQGGREGPLVAVFACAVAIAIAAASHRFVEQPLRRELGGSRRAATVRDTLQPLPAV